MCCTFIIRECTEDFTDTTKKEGNGRPGKTTTGSLDQKTTAGTKSKGRKLDTHATYMVNSCWGKVAGVIL